MASATVHAVLRAGIREFDTAPLYTDSEDKLGHALLTASPSNTGQSVVFLRDRMIVGGKEVRIYTKTGRLVRRRIKDAPEGDLGWRPAEVVKVTEDGAHGPRRVGPVTVEKTLPIPKNQRGIADDFSANGAFTSYAESLGRLGTHARVHTLRMHDADTAGGKGARLASGALDQAALPTGMLAGLKAMRTDGTIENVSLGMNAHRKHMGRWTPSVIIDLIDAVPEGTIDSALLAYGWNLLCQDGLEVMVKCQQAGIAVHIAGTFGGEQCA